MGAPLLRERQLETWLAAYLLPTISLNESLYCPSNMQLKGHDGLDILTDYLY